MHAAAPTHRRTASLLLVVSICTLLGWSVWARAGTVVALQGPLPWMGLAILICLVIDRWGCGSQKSEVGNQRSEVGSQRSEVKDQQSEARAAHSQPPTDAPSTAHRSLSTVILFWAGLAFLMLLLIQWWNAGRQPYFHPFDQRWVFTPPPHPGWPWAVDRGEAAEMLRWFFPAWALMLALRFARHPVWQAHRMAWFLVGNAAVLAVFGIVQAISGTKRIFWITPLPEHFFASFGYDNHAASYFALLFALAVGMLLAQLIAGPKSEARNQRSEIRGRDCSRSASFPTTCHLPPMPAHLPPAPAHRQPPTGAPAHRRASITTASTCAVLCLAAMVLSLSRTGMVLAAALSGLAVIVVARWFWTRVSIAQRVALMAAIVMGAATFLFLVTSVGGTALGRAATKLTTNRNERVFLMQSAAQMWVTEPWFGVGGWGYRHFVPVYALAGTGTKLSLGYANVHNDALQFLCEFGVIGFGLLLATGLAFAWPLFRRIRHTLTPGLIMASAGLGAVLLHSLIDLPFRSPGILYAWLAVCGVAGMSQVDRLKAEGC